MFKLIMALTITPLFFIAGMALLPALRREAEDPEIHQIFLEDQKDRGVGGESKPWNQTAARDQARRERVRQLLSTGQLKSAADYHDAAYIFQHGQKPSDYLLAHILAVASIEKGGSNSRWISAATIDRYLQALQQPQVFGTQFSQKNSDPPEPYTQEPFNRELFPDYLREQFCVESLEQQKKKLGFFDAGKYPPAMGAPGCSR